MLHLPDYLRDKFSGLRRAPDIRQAMRGSDNPAE
jgi:hypothetical protein